MAIASKVATNNQKNILFKRDRNIKKSGSSEGNIGNFYCVNFRWLPEAGQSCEFAFFFVLREVWTKLLKTTLFAHLLLSSPQYSPCLELTGLKKKIRIGLALQNWDCKLGTVYLRMEICDENAAAISARIEIYRNTWYHKLISFVFHIGLANPCSPCPEKREKTMLVTQTVTAMLPKRNDSSHRRGGFSPLPSLFRRSAKPMSLLPL